MYTKPNGGSLMKNKLMLIGLAAMLSVGLQATFVDYPMYVENTVSLAEQAAAEQAAYESSVIALNQKAADVKSFERLEVEGTKTPTRMERFTSTLTSAKKSTVNGSKSAYAAILALPGMTRDAAGSVKDFAVATPGAIKNGAIAGYNGIANGASATVEGVKYVYNNPKLAYDASKKATQEFTSATLKSAQETRLHKNTFGKDLGLFKYDGAVVSTVVLAGLGFGSYKIYKGGYVSKLKNRLFGKMAPQAPVVEEAPVVEKAPVVVAPVVKAPAKLAKKAPAKLAKRRK